MSAGRADRRPGGVTALGLFFLFGVLMSGLSAVSLLTPGGVLEPIWLIKPQARVGFASLGGWAPVLLIVVCAVCAGSAYGFFTGKRWGYRLGVALLVANGIGDLGNAVFGTEPAAWIGVPIVALLLVYLSSRRVKTWFHAAA